MIAVAMSALSSWLMEMYGSRPTHSPRSVGLGALTLLLHGIKKLALVESSILIASILLSNEALQMGSKQEDASPGTPTPAAEQVISDELDLKVRKYLPGGHANLEGLQDKKLKGQLAVREKLYRQSAKATAKTEKISASINDCGKFAEYLLRCAVSWNIDHLHLGIPVSVLMESLAQLEAMCERLYNSQDSAERALAESTLKCFSVDANYISQCQYILDNALTPYALMLASSSLLKQVTEQSLSLQLRLDIRNYVINYLATRGPELQNFVTGSLIQLLCRITKFGWQDDDRFKEVVQEAMNFLSQATSGHFSIGMKILNQLVSEMNQPNPGLPLALHRKIAGSFRDQSLFQIFQISLTSLHQLMNDTNTQGSGMLRQLTLSLSLRCLSYDFVVTTLDESSEEFGTVQLPGTWKPVVEDPSTLQVFFDYYRISEPPISKEPLECLV